MTDTIRDKRANRSTNTPKKLLQAKLAAFDANNIERGQQALRELAKMWRADTVPTALLTVTTKGKLLPMMEHRTDSSAGYYELHDTGEYRRSTTEAVALQDLWKNRDTYQDGDRDGATKLAAQHDLAALKQDRIPGYFPTPFAVAHQMLEFAAIEPGHAVLEPSAGSGDLAAEILSHEPQCGLMCIEINPQLADAMGKIRGLDCEVADFMTWTSQSSFDRIVMNPPFGKGQDMMHVHRAFQALSSGGRLVAIMSSGTFHRQQEKYIEFRAWLDKHTHELRDLAVDSFKESGTSVSAVIVVIHKE